MVIGSGPGAAIAETTITRTTTIRQLLSTVRPESTPSMFRPTRNTGSTKATPKVRISWRKNRRYTSAEMKLVPPAGVNAVRA